MSVSLSNVIQACVILTKVSAPVWKMKDCFAADEAEKSMKNEDLIKLPWQLFYKLLLSNFFS
jgi:hypothetical protein